MNERTCSRCRYVIQPTSQQQLAAFMARWRCPLMCMNHADSPGVLTDTWPANTCRNFRIKSERQGRTAPPEPTDDEVRYIPLTQGRYAIVDAADYEWLSQYRWCAARVRSGICYAVTTIDGKTVFMHRLIMNAPKGKVVDHIDGNGLNDRRGNLRLCTPRQNARNQRSRKGTTSAFLGVYQRSDAPEKWFAKVVCGDKKVYLGPFDDEIEAARARDRAAIKLHGEFAALNVPEEADVQARNVTGAPPPGSAK
jgi:hypothetical protein